jgi:hypothetical protein
MDRAIRGHMYNRDFREAARILNGFSQADIDLRIIRYDAGQRGDLHFAADVVGAAARRIRQPIELESALLSHRWEPTARILDSYPEAATRVPWHLRRMGAWDIAFVLHAAQVAGLGVRAAVATIVAARSAEIAASIDRAFRTRSWSAAAVLLNAVTDAEMAAGLANRPAAALFDVNAAAQQMRVTRVVNALGRQPHAGVIDIEGWDREFRRHVAASAWDSAAKVLLKYATPNDRRNRLRWLHLPQLEGLGRHVRAEPAYAALRAIVEEERVRKLNEMYEHSLRGESWPDVVRYLNAFNDADLLPKARLIRIRRSNYGITHAQSAAARIWHSDQYRVRRAIAFAGVEHLAAEASGALGAENIVTGAAAGAPVAVPGGHVTTFAHPTHTPGGGAPDVPEFFGYSYQGADARQSGWIQFLAREAEKYDARGASLGFETGVVTYAANQNEPRHWGTSRNPYWTVDTAGDDAPFYAAPTTVPHPGTPIGSAFMHTASPIQSAMWDRPDANREVLDAAFSTSFWEADVRRVVMRFKFHDYLVRGMEVLYENTMTVELTVVGRAAAAPVRHNIPGPGLPVARMRAAHHRALIRRFPRWSFYPHG